MCGLIALLPQGHTSVPVIHEALASLRHRGPDACGEWRDGDVFLGHQRLSIIDLKTGQQPMHSTDGRFVIVFNGEIYNYRELRHLLEASGSIFQTRSDTEVILEGYRQWGTSVVERLNGMFAFVLWDRMARKAFGARDRLGIKPLCWAAMNGSLVVSSTQEPFARLGRFDEIDPVAVRDLMTFDYVPAPRAIRKGVRKFEPGSRFEWTPGMAEPRIESYWRPPQADEALQPPAADELEELLTRSIERQMVSDVPIGVFLSGGIDSSLLVALMAKQVGTPIKTYTVSFSERDADESHIAAAVARRFQTEHQVLRAEETDAAALQALIGSLDEPLCDPALVPLYALAKRTREHVKVTLSGDGGDEVFGGYEKYLATYPPAASMPGASLVQRSIGSVPWRPRGIGRWYERTLSSAERFKYANSNYGDFPVFRKDLRQLFSPEFRERAAVTDFFEPWDRVGRTFGVAPTSDALMRADLRTYLSENCLVKTDRASMLASLEVRVPFLDELILDRVLPLHARHKLVGGRLKAMMAPLAERLLPEAVWNRPKHGFNVPVEVKLATIWKPVVQEALDWGAHHLPIFDYQYLRRLQRINERERVVGLELWNPVTLITWAKAQGPLRIGV